MNKEVKFLDLVIPGEAITDIEQLALAKVQEKASYLYGTQQNYSVAMAWTEAVLQHLYDLKRNSHDSNGQ